MYQRFCNPLLSNSFFLFGARGTGKTSLLQNLLPESSTTLWIDLLDEELYNRILAHPSYFEQLIPAHFGPDCWVVADEIQRIPSLLNYVHKIIEKRGIRFALSGSSARKLKRSSANLLAGRAFNNLIFPLTAQELHTDFQLSKILQWGSLPLISSLTSDTACQEYLRSYVSNYLRQEIREEQLIRRLDPFVRFLEIAAQMNGKILNASQVGRNSGTDPKTIIRYYQILEDTLLGFFLEPFHRSIRKIQTEKAKFYLFDLGVCRALRNDLTSSVNPGTYAYGEAFEHFFILECHRLRHYQRVDERAYYLRTKDDVEIDLILERPKGELYVIEIKSAHTVDEKKLGGFIKLARELKPKVILIASNEDRPRYLAPDVQVLPWRDVLTMLYPG